MISDKDDKDDKEMIKSRSRDKTRAKLISAVGKLLADKGFKGVGVNAVAREALSFSSDPSLFANLFFSTCFSRSFEVALIIFPLSFEIDRA